MAFEMLKTDYKDDILNTSVNQLRRYTIVNNADGTISLIDSTAYSTVGTFIGAKDINLICKNMNTIMGYIETSSGDLAQEFQDYFAEQKGIFEDNVEAYMQDFQNASQTQFTVWYDANTAAWSQEVENRINAIIESLTELVEDNGPFVLNKAYRVGNLLTWNIGDGITRGYLVINPVPANMGIYPSNTTYFMEVTREGAQGVGLGMTPRGNWRSIITYVENDWVVHNWVYWLCLNENTDSEPSESNANWEKIYDITADMPIQFDEPEENSLSFMEILSNIISGQTLGNLFKYIKGSFLKLLNKFKDTEYTKTGTAITYEGSNDSSVEISNVGTSTDDFYIISENDSSLNLAGLGDYEISGLIASVEHKIVTIDGDYSNTNRQIPLDLNLTAGDYIFKIIPLGGTINGIVTFKYFTRNPSNYYELKAETTSNLLSDVEFTMGYSPNYGNFTVVGASGTTVDNYSFMVVVCKKEAEYKANGALVEVGNIQQKYILDSYEGKTKVFTTSLEQVTFKAEFKTRFWRNDKKIESIKTMIHNTVNNITSINIEDDDSSINYIGAFTRVKNAGHYMSYITQSTAYDLQEDAFEYVIDYTFEGYGIDIYAYKNKGFGIMHIYIDGVYNTQVDLYAASALYQQKVYSNTTLSFGTHNIKLVYTGTKNASANGYDINVDYFKVYNINDILTPRISKNFATTDWNMVPAAPLVKELNDRLAKNEFTITPNTNYVVEDNLKTLRRINKRCDVSLMVKYNGGNFVAGAYYHVATFDEHPTKNAYLASNVTVNGSGGGVGVSSAYIAPDGKLYLATGATILNPYFFISGHFFVA